MRIRAEVLAAVLVLLVGAPFMYMLARGFADGEQRRQEIPLRAILGDATYEQWREYQRFGDGAMPPLHYLGTNRSAADITLLDQFGQPWSLADQRGKTVVMNFWTITCQPCVEEMPAVATLAAVAEERDDLEVVAITTDENWEAVKGLFGPASKLRVLFDPDGEVIREAFGTRMFPETWVVDGEGIIRLRVDGKRDWASPLSLDAIELAAH
jgi:peroxiredoxin